MNIAKKPSPKERILEKVSDYDIFKYYLGNFKLGKCIRSPFMKDEHPSLLIGMGRGGLFYRDMRGNEFYGDCFRLVMQLYGLDFIGALNKISADFGLWGDQKFELLKTEVPTKKLWIKKEFKVLSRNFTLSELEWWNRYTISEEQLKQEHIYSIKSVWIDGKKVYIEKDELAFAYYFEEVDSWKLYFPNRKRGKWFTNLEGNSFVEGKDNLVNVKKGIIGKSRKERLIFSKYFPTCNVQNESRSAFTPEFRGFLEDNVEEVYLVYDNDPPGVASCTKLTEAYGYKYVNPPRYLLRQGISDFGDLIYEDGEEGIRIMLNCFKKKGLIT